MTNPLLWDLNETASQLGGVSVRHVQRMIERGEIDSIKLGRRRMVVSESVQRWLDSQATQAHDSDRVRPDVRENKQACQHAKTGYTSAKTRRIGGCRTPTETAAAVAKVLELPSAKRPKRS